MLGHRASATDDAVKLRVCAAAGGQRTCAKRDIAPGYTAACQTANRDVVAVQIQCYTRRIGQRDIAARAKHTGAAARLQNAAVDCSSAAVKICPCQRECSRALLGQPAGAANDTVKLCAGGVACRQCARTERDVATRRAATRQAANRDAVAV